MPVAPAPVTDPRAAALLAQAFSLRRAGRLAEAIAPMRRAAELQPHSFACQHDLGLACLETGQCEAALAAFGRALALDPRSPHAWWRQGIARERLADLPGAAADYARAVELMPTIGDAQDRLANLLEALGRRTEAARAFRKLAAREKNGARARIAAARAHLIEGDDTAAERKLRQALALDHDSAAAHELLGTMLADTGRFADARGHYEVALALAPSRAGLWYDWARCHHLAAADGPAIARMDAALARGDISSFERVKLLLARGKAADDLGNPTGAMDWFDAADGVRAGLKPFDPAAFNAHIDRMIACFPRDRLAHAAAGAPTTAPAAPAPILIVGLPRSGTTLVEQIVSAHAQVGGGGELPFWSRRGPLLAGPTVDPASLADAAAAYRTILHASAPAATHVTDKQPFNYQWLGLVHLAFPHATILHCRRRAIDVALSIHQTHFSPLLPFPTGGAALVAYIRAYERLMAHWRIALPSGQLIDVDYEALVADPEPHIRRIVAATGLPWDAACLAPESNARRVRTPSKWQVRQPINAGAVDRWRRYADRLGALAPLAPQ